MNIHRRREPFFALSTGWRSAEINRNIHFASMRQGLSTGKGEILYLNMKQGERIHPQYYPGLLVPLMPTD